jgi:hypothetical protein
VPCCRTCSKKSGEPDSPAQCTAPRPQDLAAKRPTCLRGSLCEPSSLVTARFAAMPMSRCDCVSKRSPKCGTLRSAARLRLASARGLERQHQTCRTPLSRRRPCNPHKKTTAPSRGGCPRSAGSADGSEPELGQPSQKEKTRKAIQQAGSNLVEMRRLELLTPYMRSKCSTS